jgi:hypothetical protein
MIGRILVVFLTAVWLQTVVHSEVCHEDEGEATHSHSCATSSTCTCVHHTPMAQLEVAQPCLVLCVTTWVAPTDETVHSFLLPDDIFRPPVLNV